MIVKHIYTNPHSTHTPQVWIWPNVEKLLLRIRIETEYRTSGDQTIKEYQLRMQLNLRTSQFSLATASNDSELLELKRKMNYFIKCLEADIDNPNKDQTVCDLTVIAPTS